MPEAIPVEAENVFPAHAGVILSLNKMGEVFVGIPRTRGGDPAAETRRLLLQVFPAHAGVILRHDEPRAVEASIPRTRGGDPRMQAPRDIFVQYSPHTRG